LEVKAGVPDDLKERTKAFALRIFLLVDAFPNTIKGRAIAGQITRSAASVAANSRAARRARSSKEFVAKLGVLGGRGRRNRAFAGADRRRRYASPLRRSSPCSMKRTSRSPLS
jgi:hypothetical protein